MVELLRDQGACMRPKHAGWDALMVAAAGGHRGLIERLLSHGVSFTRTDARGKSAAAIAAARGHSEVAEMLSTMERVKQASGGASSLPPHLAGRGD